MYLKRFDRRRKEVEVEEEEEEEKEEIEEERHHKSIKISNVEGRQQHPIRLATF